jgi:hypothetical protein
MPVTIMTSAVARTVVSLCSLRAARFIVIVLASRRLEKIRAAFSDSRARGDEMRLTL